MKISGKPDDRKGHVRFDAAGAGNGFTVRLVRHRQTKETEQIGFTYGTPRQSSTLHVFNPRSSETHELCFLRSQHRDLYGFIPCAANALSIKPLSSSFLTSRASLSSSRFTAPIFGFCAFIKRCTWTMLSTDGSGLRSKTRNRSR